MTALSERFHGQMHFVFGVATWLLSGIIFGRSDLLTFLMAMVGAYLPDGDHLLFIYWYGKETEFSSGIKKALREFGLNGFIDYAKKNHKNNTKIKSHNLLTVTVCVALALYGVIMNSPLIGTLFISWTGHYVFDLLEDLLFFGKLNKNWWLRFD